ncbi:MAG: histidine--tRNA ligase [Rhodospirillales bacterium]|nr:histidine--tRNA ligase [Rhodospirillales bacterium]
MSAAKSPKTPQRISGFPEWLPEQRIIELQWEDIIRHHYESYGYTPLQTSVMEEVSTLCSKGGDVDNEIFSVGRLNGSEDSDKDAKIALHFDLTVPMARYVAQNYNELQFPFKRYQIQKSYRGERAQQGRYREFTQADIDVLDRDDVSIEFDAELPRIAHKILTDMGLPSTVTHINNRKLMQGFYAGLEISEPMLAIQIVDKIDKIGPDGVRDSLKTQMGLSDRVIDSCLKLAQIKSTDASFAFQVAALGVTNDTLTEGLDELSYVISSLEDLPQGSIMANMAIARGLNYYTGTVYEGKFRDYPDFATIYGGGRYDNLVGIFHKQSLPGVGISIGLTRIFGKLLEEGLINVKESSPTNILVVRYQDGADPKLLTQIAENLRANGNNVEVYHQGAKIQKQIKYALAKGIPYVLFPSTNPEHSHEIKNLSTREQRPVDPATWVVPEENRGYSSRILISPARALKPF